MSTPKNQPIPFPSSSSPFLRFNKKYAATASLLNVRTNICCYSSFNIMLCDLAKSQGLKKEGERQEKMKADRQQKEENQQFISFDAFFISSKRAFYANH